MSDRIFVSLKRSHLKYRRQLFQLVLLFATVISAANAHAEEMTGKVVSVSDGDTLTVLVAGREIKIRISGIDAPEKKQSFGQASKRSMSDCAFGKQVNVEWHKFDRYGRTIGVAADRKLTT